MAVFLYPFCQTTKNSRDFAKLNGEFLVNHGILGDGVSKIYKLFLHFQELCQMADITGL